MMVDTTTLRIAFAVLALTLIALFYFVTYRSTRAPYCAWWCAALVLFLAGATGYLLDGTAHQSWANPLANALTVLGAGAVWAGGRSLRTTAPTLWQLALAPVITGAVSLFDTPATNVWSGGPVFLAAMWLLLGLAAAELWRLGPVGSCAQLPMAFAAGSVAVFYLARWVAFLVDGQDGPVFTTWFGSEVTTLTTMALMVVVSFSMTALSNDQRTARLHAQATRDQLTGLLNRWQLLELADAELTRIRRNKGTGSLIVADLDHFKAVNDTYGHGAGDAAIRAFAAACTASVRPTDLIGRWGGEEFVLVLPGLSPDHAVGITTAISRRLAAMQPNHDFPLPTASYGIAPLAGVPDLDIAVAAADAAVYRAKADGRNRAIRAGEAAQWLAVAPG